MNIQEYQIIAHSLGVKVDKHNYDKTLPKEYYRNQFQVGCGENFEICEKLTKEGIMTKRKVFNQSVFHVTEKGIELFNKMFNELNQ